VAEDILPWTINSETGTLRDVLLCPPDYYEWIPTNDISRRALEYGQKFDKQGIFSQFRELEDALEDAEVKRHYLVPTPGLSYQVYTRDSSQVTPWGVVVTQLERPQRRGELGAILEFYRRTGEPIWKVPSAGCIEGGDIHVIRDGVLAVGYSGGRTERPGAEQFGQWFREQGWDVCLVPFAEHFLHLDVIFSMVADGIALGCIDVLDDAFLAWLSEHGIKLIEVSYKEAMQEMACNILALGKNRVISPRHSKRINAAIRAEGFTVLDPNLDLFAAGGGSVHCMTMPLRRDPLPTVAR
jgi:N-dimethylarginine dimethylaminohydrolase